MSARDTAPGRGHSWMAGDFTSPVLGEEVVGGDAWGVQSKGSHGSVWLNDSGQVTEPQPQLTHLSNGH